MTKNILSRVKQSLQSSSKKIHDQKLEIDMNSENDIFDSRMTGEKLKERRDKSEYYREVATNYQVNKLLRRIPALITQNQELRLKVDSLEQNILQLQNSPHYKSMLVSQDNTAELLRDQNTSYIRIQTDHSSSREIINNTHYQQGSLFRYKHSNCKDQQSQEKYMYRSAQKKKKNLAKLSSEVIQFFQQQVQQLKNDNEYLNSKYKTFINTKKENLEDIDKIKKDFQETLQKQEDVSRKQQYFYEQKIKSLEHKLKQLSNENQIFKMERTLINQKLAFFETYSNEKRQENIKYLSLSQQQVWSNFNYNKQLNNANLWEEDYNERMNRMNNLSGNRVKFMYPKN